MTNYNTSQVTCLIAHFTSSLENNCVGKFLLMQENLCLDFMQCLKFCEGPKGSSKLHYMDTCKVEIVLKQR